MSIVEILPTNRTRLEEGLVVAFNNLLHAVEPRFETLLNPLECPNNTLLYLANDRGVSTWISNDSEAVKRAIVKKQWPIKTIAGKRAGYEDAITPYGYRAKISSPAPYELMITMFKQGNVPVEPENIHRLETAIYQASNERDSITVSLTMSNEASFTLSGISNSFTRSRTSLYSVIPQIDSVGVLGIAGISTSFSIERKQHRSVLPHAKSGSLLKISGVTKSVNIGKTSL